MAAIFATSGCLHLVMPSPFVAIMPRMLPRPEFLVMLSGVAELLGAAGVLRRSTRRLAGWGLMLLLVAVFPANITMLANSRNAADPAWWQALLWARLPLQALLIWIVWRVAIGREGKRAAIERESSPAAVR